ncbi:hypothetical protein F7725_010262 [Dissostichus mawsoni]|uniref:Uncharacterized protein n=1 Tax=Dissostichus mawsoni TaxID=36200 RepID=A0A7J5XN61_DISMA|nr:hypothetical protein F7725_010262 [Dissostichus mawsoni]
MSTAGFSMSPSIFGTDTPTSPLIVGPLRFMSTLGAFTSMSALGRLISTSGTSTFGPSKPNDGIWIFGILIPPFSPSISTAGALISTSGVFMSPLIFGIDMSISPLSLGPFRLKSTFGIERFGPEMVVRGININISCWDADINVWSFSMWTFQPKGWHFECRHFESSFVTIKVNFWSFNIHLGAFMLPLIFGTEKSRSPFMWGPLMSTSGVLISMFASGRFRSTSGPSNFGPLMFHDGILMLGILKPLFVPSMSTSGHLMSTSGVFVSFYLWH